MCVSRTILELQTSPETFHAGTKTTSESPIHDTGHEHVLVTSKDLSIRTTLFLEFGQWHASLFLLFLFLPTPFFGIGRVIGRCSTVLSNVVESHDAAIDFQQVFQLFVVIMIVAAWTTVWFDPFAGWFRRVVVVIFVFLFLLAVVLLAFCHLLDAFLEDLVESFTKRRHGLVCVRVCMLLVVVVVVVVVHPTNGNGFCVCR